MKRLRYLYGWVFVRPRRWFFWQMIGRGSFGLHLIPRKRDWGGWQLPNLHWWLLYWTVFKFFKWVHYEAWRPFCTWDKWLIKKPLIAKIIHRIGKTTAGHAISGGECYHCASPDGNPVDLSNEDGPCFKLERTWAVGTQDGTDYRFSGTTICPACGYQGYYEDGSL